jgi:hypothetical protein
MANTPTSTTLPGRFLVANAPWYLSHPEMDLVWKPKDRDRHPVEAIIDVWCDAPVLPTWREIADSAIDPEKREELWGDLEYWFVMGVHP